LPNTEFEGAFKIAESMRENVQALNIPHKSSETYGHVTISAGVASIVPDSQLRSFDLLEKADKALYQAKDAGRNLVKGAPAY